MKYQGKEIEVGNRYHWPEAGKDWEGEGDREVVITKIEGGYAFISIVGGGSGLGIGLGCVESVFSAQGMTLIEG